MSIPLPYRLSTIIFLLLFALFGLKQNVYAQTCSVVAGCTTCSTTFSPTIPMGFSSTCNGTSCPTSGTAWTAATTTINNTLPNTRCISGTLSGITLANSFIGTLLICGTATFTTITTFGNNTNIINYGTMNISPTTVGANISVNMANGVKIYNYGTINITAPSTGNLTFNVSGNNSTLLYNDASGTINFINNGANTSNFRFNEDPIFVNNGKTVIGGTLRLDGDASKFRLGDHSYISVASSTRISEDNNVCSAPNACADMLFSGTVTGDDGEDLASNNNCCNTSVSPIIGIFYCGPTFLSEDGGTTDSGSALKRTSGCTPSYTPRCLNSALLPIELVYFHGTPNVSNHTVSLQWATALEVNNKLYEIERSSDGFDFVAFTRVAGAGTSDSEKKYEAIDKNPFMGISYYRLKQTDIDGTYTYSKIVAIDMGSRFNAVLYPNPATEEINIAFNTTVSEIHFQIINPLNKTIREEIAHPNGHSLKIDTSGLADGIYIIRLFTLEGVVARKFIVKH